MYLKLTEWLRNPRGTFLSKKEIMFFNLSRNIHSQSPNQHVFFACFFHTHFRRDKAPGLHVSKLQAVFGKQDVLGFDLHVALEINTSAPFLRQVLVTWAKLEVVI